jgi:hypothetical protein
LIEEKCSTTKLIFYEGKKLSLLFSQQLKLEQIAMDQSNWVEIRRGAEASIHIMTLMGIDCVAKVQVPKTWRVPELDIALRNERFHNEIRTNLRCIKIVISVAPIVFADVHNSIVF